MGRGSRTTRSWSLAVWTTRSASGTPRTCTWRLWWRVRRTPRSPAWPSWPTAVWWPRVTKTAASGCGTWRSTRLWPSGVTNRTGTRIRSRASSGPSTRTLSFWCAAATTARSPSGRYPRKRAPTLTPCSPAPSTHSSRWSSTTPRYPSGAAIERSLKADTKGDRKKRRRWCSLALRSYAFNSTLILRTWPTLEVRVAEHSKEAMVTWSLVEVTSEWTFGISEHMTMLHNLEGIVTRSHAWLLICICCSLDQMIWLLAYGSFRTTTMSDFCRVTKIVFKIWLYSLILVSWCHVRTIKT